MRLSRLARTATLAALVLATLTLSATSPSIAHADAGAKIWNRDRNDHGFHIDVHAGFSWWGRGFAGGARFNIPLLREGFLRGKNDAFFLSLGVDSYFVRWRGGCGGDVFCSHAFGLGFPVAAHWEFYFFEKLSFFAEAGVNVFLHPGVLRGNRRRFVEDPGVWVIAAAGIRWRFGRNVAFVARLGTPYVSAGLSFSF